MSTGAGNTVVVTGGAGGIGTAIAQRYGQTGATVVAVDRDESALEQLAQRFHDAPFTLLTKVCDITDAEACNAVVSSSIAETGGIDVLVNNAGLTQIGLCENNDADVYRRVMEVNFFGAVHMTQAALPYLIERRGGIAVLSSVAGFAPLVGRTGYCASKHALHGFFNSLRAELSRQDVSVTLVCPTFAKTGFHRAGLASDGAALGGERSTTGDAVTPEEIAEALYQGVQRGTPVVPVGRTAKIAWLASRYLPRFYERQMTRRFQDEFDGK